MINNIKMLLKTKYFDIGRDIKAQMIKELPKDKALTEVYFSAEDVFKLIDEVVNDEIKKFI